MIKLVVLDIDGVITDGTVIVDMQAQVKPMYIPKPSLNCISKDISWQRLQEKIL